MSMDWNALQEVIQNLRTITGSLRNQYEALDRISGPGNQYGTTNTTTGISSGDDRSSSNSPYNPSVISHMVKQLRNRCVDQRYNSTVRPGGTAFYPNATGPDAGSSIPQQNFRNASAPSGFGRTYNIPGPTTGTAENSFIEHLRREGYPFEALQNTSTSTGTNSSFTPSNFESYTRSSSPGSGFYRSGPTTTSTPVRGQDFSSSGASEGEDILEALLLWWSRFIMTNLSSNDCSFITTDSEFLTTLEEIVLVWRQRSQSRSRSP